MPTFSIIVPLYNAAPYVAEALESIAAQTYTDFEVIVIDDGSTDEGGRIAREYCARDPRFCYVRQENQGVSAARNHGIARSTGKYLYYVDSDDRIRADLLQTCHSVLCDDSIDIVLFCAGVFPESAPKYEVTKNYYQRPAVASPLPSTQFIIESLRQDRYFVSPCCYIAKRSVLGELRFTEGMIYEDNLFFLSLLLERPLRAAVVHENLFLRRLRANSITTAPKTRRNYDSMSKLLYKVTRLPMAALADRRQRQEARIHIAGGILRALAIFSHSIGATPALRLRTLLATLHTALFVSPRFFAPRHYKYALWPATAGGPSPADDEA